MSRQATSQPKAAEPGQDSGLQSVLPARAREHSALPKAIGNRAVLRTLQIGPAGDAFEREADTAADAVLAMPAGSLGKVATVRAGGPVIARKCAGCQDEEEEKLRRTPANAAMASPGAVSIHDPRGKGMPLPVSLRSFFEPRFGCDFSEVRAHTDAEAAESARSVQARAFTVGADIVFGAGEYRPDSEAGRRLIAHELTHVVQQGSAGDLIRRAPATEAEPEAPAPPAPERESPGSGEAAPQSRVAASPAILVEDESTTVGANQMRRSDFLAAVRAAVCATADEGMAGTGRTSAGCPYISYWFDNFGAQSVSRLERTMRRFAPETAGVATAQDAVPLISARVRQSVDRWAKTGEVSGLPEGIPLDIPGAAGILFKAKPGGTHSPASPTAVRHQLGEGTPLESGVRSRMESALGGTFSGVRAHTGVSAARLAAGMSAGAFTVGDHVAFGAGEYQPGTPVGDALIAHELAHVVQQQGGTSHAPATASSLEADADAAASAALIPLWSGLLRGAVEMGRRVQPSLRAGLQLQRCNRGPELRDPREVANAFQTAQRELLASLPEGSTRANVELVLTDLNQIFTDRMTDAGSDTRKQAEAQQWFLDQIARLRESVAPQAEMTRRYGIDFVAEPVQSEFSRPDLTQPATVRYKLVAWSREELQKVDAILKRVPRPYLANVRKVSRQPFDTGSMSAAAAWQETIHTVYIYNQFFSSDISDSQRAEGLVHELGHSLEPERRVGNFQHLPSPQWMRLSDWQTSTRASIAADLGWSDRERDANLAALDGVRNAFQGFPRPIQIGDRMVVPDRYEGQFGSNQFFHYAAAHDAEFVSPYARSHPADDLAESFAHFILHPDDTREKLDRGPRGQMDKWDYLVQLAQRQQQPQP